MERMYDLNVTMQH